MTKRIVSGIFILTALGALGVILAGALTSGEQLIVRFLTAVIVAALGLYVISDLRLQADDDAMTSRSSGSARLTSVDAPPNSTAAFMATVTKKSDVVEGEDESEVVEEAEPISLPEPVVAEHRNEVAMTGTDAGVFGRIDESVVLDVNDQTMVGVAVSTGELAAVAGDPLPTVSASTDDGEPAMLSGDRTHRRIVPSRPSVNGNSSRADATVTDIFAATTTTFSASSLLGDDESSEDSAEHNTGTEDGTGAEDETTDANANPSPSKAPLFPTAKDESILGDGPSDAGDDTVDALSEDVDATTAAASVRLEDDFFAAGPTTDIPAADATDLDTPGQSDDAGLTRILQFDGNPPAAIDDTVNATADGPGDDVTVSEFKSGEAALDQSVNGSSRNGSFANGATSAKISFSSSPVGDNVSFGDGIPFVGSEDVDADDALDFAVHDLADLDGSKDHDDSADDKSPLAATDFEYSDDLDSPEQTWPAPPAKVSESNHSESNHSDSKPGDSNLNGTPVNGHTVNGVGKAHPFEKIALSDSGSGLNGQRTTLPAPAANGLQAADYADAPLAPIIDLRDINHSSDNIDVAINAGEVEVIATLIEQGMLSTEGPISDRDVRTMVYVAFTSNELRKLLLAGGSPDGPNEGLDLGPVELFDERIHAPAPKRLYSGTEKTEAQKQLG